MGDSQSVRWLCCFVCVDQMLTRVRSLRSSDEESGAMYGHTHFQRVAAEPGRRLAPVSPGDPPPQAPTWPGPSGRDPSRDISSSSSTPFSMEPPVTVHW
ncbi:hypothetical protein GBAR_LOCUS24277 [Geodia barretti]|uniref:Uncharacterized protein n=1 Tax=Geodia barretti TaxID=519541 RepID=A0AA35X398_GEOBA|nr:hypothetical protein GBAR_LOCUS24277 [Geodia barretti]